MIKIFKPKNWREYEILDTGEGQKLERLGEYTFVRPLEDAVWGRTVGEDVWNGFDGKFWSSKAGSSTVYAKLAKKSDKAGWKLNSKVSPRWPVVYDGIKFWSLPTPFRHFGFFPEQASHWEFIEQKIKEAKALKDRPVKFLNLFGYTGVASLFALRAGAEVTHLDASKPILNMAKDNQKLSGLENLPMRVIADDALKFLEREAKRGNKYDAIIMDPPKFGRGPKGEVWKIEEGLAELLTKARNVLSDDPIFVIVTSYATESSSLSLGHALRSAMDGVGGDVEQGELCLVEKSNDRVISLANTAVWVQG